MLLVLSGEGIMCVKFMDQERGREVGDNQNWQKLTLC